MAPCPPHTGWGALAKLGVPAGPLPGSVLLLAQPGGACLGPWAARLHLAPAMPAVPQGRAERGSCLPLSNRKGQRAGQVGKG